MTYYHSLEEIMTWEENKLFENELKNARTWGEITDWENKNIRSGNQIKFNEYHIAHLWKRVYERKLMGKKPLK